MASPPVEPRTKSGAGKFSLIMAAVLVVVLLIAFFWQNGMLPRAFNSLFTGNGDASVSDDSGNGDGNGAGQDGSEEGDLLRDQILNSLTASAITTGNGCDTLLAPSTEANQPGTLYGDVVAFSNPAEWQLPVGTGPGTKMYSYSISTPLVEQTSLQELKVENCRNPTTFYTWCYAVAHFDVAGTLVSDIPANGFLADCAGDTTTIQQNALAILQMGQALKDGDPTDEELQAYKQANLDYQEKVGLLNTLLDQFFKAGVDTPTSVSNLRLGGVQTGLAPEVVLSDRQESLPALVLMVTDKEWVCDVPRFGINVQDKRPEYFSNTSCSEGQTPLAEAPVEMPHVAQPSTPAEPSTPGGGTPSISSSPPPPGSSTPPSSSSPPPPTSSSPPPQTCNPDKGCGAPVSADAPRGDDTRATSSAPRATTSASDPGRGDSGAGATSTTSAPATATPAVTVPNSGSDNEGDTGGW